MRRTQDFKTFLREKYEAGRADIQHPDPEKRQRRRTVKFWTAMKYDNFKSKVKREFQAWLQEKEAARPRAQVGAPIQNADEVRVGDFLQYGWGTRRFKVMRVSPQSLVLQQIDANGRPTENRTRRHSLSRIRRNRMKRIDEVKRPDVTLEQAKAYIDDKHQFPPRDVKNKQDYAQWLEKKFRDGGKSPFYRLGDDEVTANQQLKDRIKEILEDRGVGEDWEWQPPAPVQIGERVKHPLQLDAGDFVKYYDTTYRIIKTNDEKIRAVAVDQNGRPRGGERDFTTIFLQRYPIKRVAPVERPDVTLSQAKEFAEKTIGFPPKNINSRTEYRDWLEEKFRTKPESPYAGLGADELEHKNSLEKQIKKILEDRGVGPDWEWAPPPELEVGERLQDGYQARPGHFIKSLYDYKYKVLGVDDDGNIEVIRVDSNGIPKGSKNTLNRNDIRRTAFTRIEEVKRPEVSLARTKEFADLKLSSPKRSVTNQDQYRKWLTRNLKEMQDSPYYKLDDNELEHQEKLKDHVEKLLEDRGIGEDWTWTPPPLITFPTDPDWEAKEQQILDTAISGQKQGRDRGVGGGGVNGAKLRTMRLGDRDQKFVFKSKHKEPGQPGSGYNRQLSNKTGIPSGEMHNREKGAYELDRLLGAGTVIPPTTSTGEGHDGLGAYQTFVDGFTTFNNESSRSRFSRDDMLRHADVGRIMVLDALMGHQDRHGGNIGISRVDPNGPTTPQNTRFHAIDNGYALAETRSNQSSGSWDIRDPWRSNLFRDYFEAMPQDMQDRLARVSTKDLASALIGSGLKNKSLLEAAAVRLAVLKDNPEALYSLMSQHCSREGQRQFQYLSHHKPDELLRNHTDLDPDALESIRREINETLSASRS